MDRIFTDKASGKNTARPQLQELLAYVREGDTIVVHSMDRLARNVDDLRPMVSTQTKRGVRVQFIKEHLVFTGEDSPLSNLLLSVLGGVAQFEGDLIKERQMEGITLAKKRRVYKGRKKSLAAHKIEEVRRRAKGFGATFGCRTPMPALSPSSLSRGQYFQDVGLFWIDDHSGASV